MFLLMSIGDGIESQQRFLEPSLLRPFPANSDKAAAVHYRHTHTYIHTLTLHVWLFLRQCYYNQFSHLCNNLLLLSEKQLKAEIRSLIWLAMLTDRSVIIPNLLGDDRIIRTIDQVYNRTMWPGFRVANIAKRVKVCE